MRLKDIIESWSDLPGQHERRKTPEELQAEEEAELNDQIRHGNDPDAANKAGQKLGKLLRAKQRDTAERDQQKGRRERSAPSKVNL